MPVTNRKKKKKTHGQREFAEEKHDAEIKPKVQRRIMRRLASVVLAVIATASIQRLYKAQQMFGWLYFVPERFKHLSLSAEEWQKILEKKKVLFIGGHHRAGTTLIWNHLRHHPNVVGFGNKTGSDFSEGIFLQDVYPSFGIGRDFQRNSQSVYDPNITILETVIDVFLESILIRQPVRRRLNNSMETTKFKGLGRYALAPEDHVHWTPELKQREINAHNQARLLNKFGYHWTMSKIEDPNIKILLEKSPPNAVLSTFLQSLINLGHCNNDKCWQSSTEQTNFNQISSAAIFIFMQRHPIATSLAHMAWRDCQGLTLNDLMANWVAVSLYMHIDFPRLQQATVIRLEDFADDPASLLAGLYDWLQLDPISEAELTINTNTVYSDPNAKYLDQYCSSHYTRQDHAALQSTWQDAVSRFGYDLTSWGAACEKRANDEFSE